MLNNVSAVTLVTALAGATGYPNVEPAQELRPPAMSARISAEIRSARVELYTGHRSAAALAIRRARQEAEATARAPATAAVLALEEAARQVRLHQTDAALATLDQALLGLNRSA